MLHSFSARHWRIGPDRERTCDKIIDCSVDRGGSEQGCIYGDWIEPLLDFYAQPPTVPARPKALIQAVDRRPAILIHEHEERLNSKPRQCPLGHEALKGDITQIRHELGFELTLGGAKVAVLLRAVRLSFDLDQLELV